MAFSMRCVTTPSSSSARPAALRAGSSGYGRTLRRRSRPFRTSASRAAFGSTFVGWYNPTPTGPGKYGITDKQAEALELAFEEGYFDVPRGTTQTELAEMIGISRQAYARRLNRALDSLVDNTFMTGLNESESEASW